MGGSKLGNRDLAQTQVQHLAFGHQFRHGSDRFFDRDGRIHPVLVVEIEAVGAEPRQGTRTARLDMSRPTIDFDASAGCRHQSELARQDHLVPPAPDDLADKRLVFPACVAVGGIQKSDAKLQGQVQRGRDSASSGWPNDRVRTMPPRPSRDISRLPSFVVGMRPGGVRFEAAWCSIIFLAISRRA